MSAHQIDQSVSVPQHNHLTNLAGEGMETPLKAEHSFERWRAAALNAIERDLEVLLNSYVDSSSGVLQAMVYALRGGRRFPSLLTLAAAELTGAPELRPVRVASAIELAQASKLIQINRSCLDTDIFHAGKEACDSGFDKATALLAADALQALAFEVLSAPGLTSALESQLEMIRTLARACGMQNAVAGQPIESQHNNGDAVGFPEVEFIHQHRTGFLIRAAVLVGAQSGAGWIGSTAQDLEIFADFVGLAYQIVDDIFDYESSMEPGNAAGNDEALRRTYVSVFGSNASLRKATSCVERATRVLQGYDSKADKLRRLAREIVARPNVTQ